MFVLLLRKEDVNSYSCPAEDGNYKGNLNFIAGISESIIVNDPECIGELNQLLFTKQVLWFFLVHNQAFFDQSISHPLMKFRLALRTLCFKKNILTSYTAHLSSSSMRLLIT